MFWASVFTLRGGGFQNSKSSQFQISNFSQILKSPKHPGGGEGEEEYGLFPLFGTFLSKPQHNLNAKVGFYVKMTSHHHHQPPSPPTTTTQTQCQEYLSCYWPNFDETSKVGSWEYPEQIPTVMLTFVQVTFVLATIIHIRNISDVTDQTLNIGFFDTL